MKSILTKSTSIVPVVVFAFPAALQFDKTAEMQTDVVTMEPPRKRSKLAGLFHQCMFRDLGVDSDDNIVKPKSLAPILTPSDTIHTPQIPEIREMPGSFIRVSDHLESITRVKEMDISNVVLSETPKRKFNPLCLRIKWVNSAFSIERLVRSEKLVRNRLIQLLSDDDERNNRDATTSLVARVANIKIEGPWECKKDNRDEHFAFKNELHKVLQFGLEV